MKDCIEHLYSWDYTISDALGCPGCAERERIIKLLEGLKGTCSGDCEDCRTYAHRTAHYLTAIQELIKGEK